LMRHCLEQLNHHLGKYPLLQLLARI
jgi:hypothetical protein